MTIYITLETIFSIKSCRKRRLMRRSIGRNRKNWGQLSPRRALERSYMPSESLNTDYFNLLIFKRSTKAFLTYKNTSNLYLFIVYESAFNFFLCTKALLISDRYGFWEWVDIFTSQGPLIHSATQEGLHLLSFLKVGTFGVIQLEVSNIASRNKMAQMFSHSEK